MQKLFPTLHIGNHNSLSRMIHQSSLFVTLQVVPQSVGLPAQNIMELDVMGQFVDGMPGPAKILSVGLQSLVEVIFLGNLGQQVTSIVQGLLSWRCQTGLYYPFQNGVIVVAGCVQNRSIAVVLNLVYFAAVGGDCGPNAPVFHHRSTNQMHITVFRAQHQMSLQNICNRELGQSEVVVLRLVVGTPLLVYYVVGAESPKEMRFLPPDELVEGGGIG